MTVDATPLVGPMTGVGRYVEGLLGELEPAASRRGEELTLRAAILSARRRKLERAGAPPVTGLPVPARLLRRAWSRADAPPVELVVGRCDVFHGTNFVSPPTLRAAEVLTIHDLAYERHRDTVGHESLAYRALVPRALNRGAVVVTPSAATRDAVCDFYRLAAERVVVTPLGVDDVWRTAAPLSREGLARLGVPSDYFLFVGTVEPRKNLPVLVEAYRRMASCCSDPPALVLAGPAGWARLPAVERDLPGLVQVGWVEQQVLCGLVAGARAVALVSRDEGFGLPVVEAMTSGRPVVVSDIPALREVAGDLGVVVPVDDVDALAHALAVLAEQEDSESGQRGRRDWAARWTWRACAEATLDAYRLALEGRR
ncbi:MAG: glycosyltransferase family 4 protein [Actinomycetes bacterium]